jgi:hypothetical protein
MYYAFCQVRKAKSDDFESHNDESFDDFNDFNDFR